MDIIELGAIGELVGGVAVFVTLVYLAVQVRHGRNDLRFGSELHLSDVVANRAFNYALSPDIARILELSFTDLPPAGDVDISRSANAPGE